MRKWAAAFAALSVVQLAGAKGTYSLRGYGRPRYVKHRTYGRYEPKDFDSVGLAMRRLWCWSTGDDKCAAAQPFLVEALSASLPAYLGSRTPFAKLAVRWPNACWLQHYKL